MIQSTACLIVLLAACSAWDRQFGRIPNEYCAAGLAFGLVCRDQAGGWFLGLALACLLSLLTSYVSRVSLAAGDWKLFAAVGALVGPAQVFVIYVFSTLLLAFAPARIRRPGAPWLLLGAIPVIAWRLAHAD